MPEGSMGHDAMMDSLIASAGMTEDTWATVEGQYIKYEDLTDSHLRNIVNYLQRLSPSDFKGRIHGILQECDRRGWTRTYALRGE